MESKVNSSPPFLQKDLQNIFIFILKFCCEILIKKLSKCQI